MKKEDTLKISLTGKGCQAKELLGNYNRNRWRVCIRLRETENADRISIVDSESNFEGTERKMIEPEESAKRRTRPPSSPVGLYIFSRYI